MNNAAKKLKISNLSIKNKNGNNLVYPYITPNTLVNYKPSTSPDNLSGNVIIARLKNRDLIEIEEFKVGHTYVCENPYAKKNVTFTIIKMDEPRYFVDNNFDNNFDNRSYDLQTNVYSIICEIVYNRPQIDGNIPDNNIARAFIYSNKDGKKTLDATFYNDRMVIH